jgi:hypothetical protein
MTVRKIQLNTFKAKVVKRPNILRFACCRENPEPAGFQSLGDTQADPAGTTGDQQRFTFITVVIGHFVLPEFYATIPCGLRAKLSGRCITEVAPGDRRLKYPFSGFHLSNPNRLSYTSVSE